MPVVPAIVPLGADLQFNGFAEFVYTEAVNANELLANEAVNGILVAPSKTCMVVSPSNDDVGIFPK